MIEQRENRAKTVQRTINLKPVRLMDAMGSEVPGVARFIKCIESCTCCEGG